MKPSILDITNSPASCHMCKHYRSDEDAFECTYSGELPDAVEDAMLDGHEEAALSCPAFETRPGWNTPEREMPITFEEPAEEQFQQWAYEDALRRGYIDPESGEPTEEFFRASDEAYGVSR